MKHAKVVRLLACVLLASLHACGDIGSPTGPANRKNMLTRFWSGEEFFTLNINGVTFRAKDIVQELTFASDGSYYLYKPSMSTIVGRSGLWDLEDCGTSLRLRGGNGDSEVFAIHELSSTILILGDTTSRGFALVPYNKWDGMIPK